MSFNNIKVGDSKPNASGVITPQLTDLSDVSGDPSDGQFLKYSSSSSSWTPSASSSSSAVSFIFFGRGESENYSESPATNLSANSVLNIYDEGAVNTISGATLNTTTSTGGGGGEWLNSVALPAGTYRFILTCLPSFSSSGYFAYALKTGSTRITSVGTVGASTNLYGAGGPVATSIYTAGSSITVVPYIVAVSGVDNVASQGNAISTSTTLYVEKLG